MPFDASRTPARRSPTSPAGPTPTPASRHPGPGRSPGRSPGQHGAVTREEQVSRGRPDRRRRALDHHASRPAPMATASIRSVPGSFVRLENRTKRPPGSTICPACRTSWRPVSRVVRARGPRLRSGRSTARGSRVTRCRTLPRRARPRGRRWASRGELPIGERERDDAVARENASFVLSGENAAPPTPDPGISSVSALSSRRTNCRRAPFLTPAIDTNLPSGEIANPLSSPGTGSICAGNTTSKCNTRCMPVPGVTCQSAHAAARTAAVATAHGSRRVSDSAAPIARGHGSADPALLERDPRFADRAGGAGRPARGSRRSSAARSAESRRAARPVGLVLEHRGERVADGLAGEEALARQHLEQHAPNDQMSARRSTGLPRACSGDM